MNQLDQIKQFTTIVADTSDFSRLRTFNPQDATTNPSLILRAVQSPSYANIIHEIRSQHPNASIDDCINHLLVRFGIEILNIIPGRVSTEIDADLSFDIEESLLRARQIIDLYEAQGIDRKRVLIKIAGTWEGIQTARILEREGIACNVTLIFHLVQAVACADAKVTLISPFVGRITDWYKKSLTDPAHALQMTGKNDPGVQSVTQIYHYLKHYDHATQIMGASFRNIEQIIALAGCDLLTISPELLDALKQSTGSVTAQLLVAKAKELDIPKLTVNEKSFRQMLNDDAMATEKLAEGIRNFKKDTLILAKLLQG